MLLQGRVALGRQDRVQDKEVLEKTKKQKNKRTRVRGVGSDKSEPETKAESALPSSVGHCNKHCEASNKEL